MQTILMEFSLATAALHRPNAAWRERDRWSAAAKAAINAGLFREAQHIFMSGPFDQSRCIARDKTIDRQCLRGKRHGEFCFQHAQLQPL